MFAPGSAIKESTDVCTRFNTDIEGVSESYEYWLACGFSQAAYMARDFLRHGFVLSETRKRVRNEQKGMAIEKLGEPYITSFEYNNVDGCLRAEDGEMFVPIFTRGYDKASEYVEDDPRLAFLLKRHEADIDHAMFLQELASDPGAPIGTTVVINSPSPSPSELGIPIEILEDYNYRPNEKLAMQWVATKTLKGIRLQTSSLFNAEPQQLAEATSMVSGQPVWVSDRESMPGQRTVFIPGLGVDVAHQLQMEFDNIQLRETGKQTFHGLEPDNHAGEDVTWLVETNEFKQALSASQSIIERVAESLVTGEFLVDREYMKQLLAIKKSDGIYELDGDYRNSVEIIINSSRPSDLDFYPALQAAKKGADAIIWATLRNLYDGKKVKNAIDVSEAIQIGVSNVEEHRQQGTEEYGCPGGASGSRQKSIFDTTADQLASAFMRRIFITNCPLCEEKNVTATQENGTITCGSCSGCVEVCTGAVISKSRKQAKVQRESGKLAAKSFGIIELIIAEWKSGNNKSSRKSKVKKYEKIAA